MFVVDALTGESTPEAKHAIACHAPVACCRGKNDCAYCGILSCRRRAGKCVGCYAMIATGDEDNYCTGTQYCRLVELGREVRCVL